MEKIKLNFKSKYEEGNSIVKEYDIFLLLKNEKIGYVEIVENDSKTTLNDIFIYEERRNNGYGTQIIKDFANEYGSILVAPTNEENKRLYLKLGEEASGNVPEIDQGYGVYEI